MVQLNPRELDVLNILWKSEDAMMATDIVNAGEGLTQSTVTAVLRKLLKDDLVEVVGITHSGRVLSRTYRPTENSREVILQNFTHTYSCFNNIISESTLCAAILTDNKAPDKAKTEIKKLKSLLTDYEKSMK